MLEFDAFQRIDDYASEFIVTASGDGLTAHVPVIYGPGAHELWDFLNELSQDFRGWHGVRSWRSLEDHLRVEAAWHSGGYVALGFQLTPSVYEKWSVTVEVMVEASEELKGLADELCMFMTS